jgi:cold shock CspA family protein
MQAESSPIGDHHPQTHAGKSNNAPTEGGACPGPKKNTKKLKSKKNQLRDEMQQSTTGARRDLAKATRQRRALKLQLKQLKVGKGKGRPNPKKTQGHTRGSSSKRAVADQPLCQFYLTNEDRSKVCAVVNLPQGVTQHLRSCVSATCEFLHTEQASSLRRDRLIQTRRRKVAAALRPQKTDKDSEEQQGWLKKFSFDTGYGFITPIKLNLGGRARKQELFFHKSEWVGRPSLDRDSYRLPLRVRYTRAAPDDVRKRTRAVRVSATGPHRPTTVQVAAAIARRVARSAAAAARAPTVASATEETATAQATGEQGGDQCA